MVREDFKYALPYFDGCFFCVIQISNQFILPNMINMQAEGIFRINAENSQEEYVRDQLNKGIVPDNIDVHCLSGLIKVEFTIIHQLTPPFVWYIL